MLSHSNGTWKSTIHTGKLCRRLIFEVGQSATKLLREVLCLECHPYAAHIFASEGNKMFDINSATLWSVLWFLSNVLRSLLPRGPHIFLADRAFGHHSKESKARASQGLLALASGNSVAVLLYLIGTIAIRMLKTSIRKYWRGKYNRKSNEGCVCARPVASSLRKSTGCHARWRRYKSFVCSRTVGRSSSLPR